MPIHRMLLLRQIKAKSVLGFNKWASINHYSKSFDFDCENWHVSKTYTFIAEHLNLDKNIWSAMTSIFQKIFISKPGSIWRGLSAKSHH